MICDKCGKPLDLKREDVTIGAGDANGPGVKAHSACLGLAPIPAGTIEEWKRIISGESPEVQSDNPPPKA